MEEETRFSVLPKVALGLGIPLAAAGLFLLGTYLVGVVEIIVDQPPDRSWLFWGLGVAFIGITLLGGGIGLMVVWWKTRSRRGAD